MKDLAELEAYRRKDRAVYDHFGWFGDHGNGLFMLPYPRTGVDLKCLASNGEGWDHVSVSLPNRCPNWLEMEHVKRAFFEDSETAMQLHAPRQDHVNHHPFCLHLWRPNDGREIPRPHAILVGPVTNP